MCVSQVCCAASSPHGPTCAGWLAVRSRLVDEIAIPVLRSAHPNDDTGAGSLNVCYRDDVDFVLHAVTSDRPPDRRTRLVCCLREGNGIRCLGKVAPGPLLVLEFENLCARHIAYRLRSLRLRRRVKRGRRRGSSDGATEEETASECECWRVESG